MLLNAFLKSPLQSELGIFTSKIYEYPTLIEFIYFGC